MAFLSEMLNEEYAIPQKHREQSAICIICGKKQERGGMWATQVLYASVCGKCAPVLLDWYIDALLDTQEIDESDDVANVKRLSNDIIERYERKKQKKIRYNKKHI